MPPKRKAVDLDSSVDMDHLGDGSPMQQVLHDQVKSFPFRVMKAQLHIIVLLHVWQRGQPADVRWSQLFARDLLWSRCPMPGRPD